MVKSEISKILHSKRSLCFIIILIIIPVIDFWMQLKDIRLASGYDEYLKHPAMAGFLSASTLGHFPQMLFFWIFPLFCIIIYSNFIIQEKKCGLTSSLVVRIGQRKYYKFKMILSFCIFFTVVFVSLLVNFFMVLVAFHHGQSFQGLEQLLNDKMFTGSFMCWEIKHAYLNYFIFIISTSIICGLCGVMCSALASILQNAKTLYITSIIIWFLQFSILPPLVPNYYHCDIFACLQPFTESGIVEICIASSFYLLTISAILIILYRKRVSCDEI